MMGQKMDKPCGDCWDGYCAMNCGPAVPDPRSVHERALREFYAAPTLSNARQAIHELRTALAKAKNGQAA